MNRNQMVVDKINATFPEAIAEEVDFRGEQTLLVAKSQLKSILLIL